MLTIIKLLSLLSDPPPPPPLLWNPPLHQITAGRCPLTSVPFGSTWMCCSPRRPSCTCAPSRWTDTWASGTPCTTAASPLTPGPGSRSWRSGPSRQVRGCTEEGNRRGRGQLILKTGQRSSGQCRGRPRVSRPVGGQTRTRTITRTGTRTSTRTRTRSMIRTRTMTSTRARTSSRTRTRTRTRSRTSTRTRTLTSTSTSLCGVFLDVSC